VEGPDRLLILTRAASSESGRNQVMVAAGILRGRHQGLVINTEDGTYMGTGSKDEGPSPMALPPPSVLPS